MKKIIMISLLMFISCFYYQNIKASDYLTYQEIVFDIDGGELLEDFSYQDYEKYYGRLQKRRFWGWITLVSYDAEEVTFTKETLYIIENQGDTAITQTFSVKTEEQVKKQYSVTGSLGMNISGKEYGFKLGLEEELKYSITATKTSSVEEEFEIKVYVDPMTKLIVQIQGEGKVSSGVAKYYRFWKNVKKGGWEIFVVTTEYYSLQKIRIDET